MLSRWPGASRVIFGKVAMMIVLLPALLVGLETTGRAYAESWFENALGVRALSPSGMLSSLVADPGDSTSLGNRIPVVLIHGWNPLGVQSLADRWNGFAVSFYSDARFRNTQGRLDKFKLYRLHWNSNTDSIRELGRQLTDLIDKLDQVDPEFNGKPLLIIAHSAGGLIARSYMQEHWSTLSSSESPYGGKPGGARVVRLITLATPHHGSVVANGPYRDAWIAAYDRKHAAGIPQFTWLMFADLLEFKLPSFDTPNRSDLHWDDSGRLFDYENAVADPYRRDRNDWLQGLNCVAPYDSGHNCVETNYADKIVAYGSAYSPPRWGDDATGAAFACKPYEFYTSEADLLSKSTYCMAQNLMEQVFGLTGDGIVPLYSALYTNPPPGKPEPLRRRMPDYDHSEMIEGKKWASPQSEWLFSNIRDDLYSSWPDSPQAILSMQSGGKTGMSRLVLTVPRGTTVPVTFSSSGSTAVNGVIAAYDWRINNVQESTASAFPRSLGPGTYEVYLTVTDTVGQEGPASGQLVIQEEASPVERPQVITLLASKVSNSSAVLNGQVLPRAPSASAWFEYGTTAAYGQSTAASTIAGNVSAYVSQAIANLTPGITYHFRLVAQNQAGVTGGADQTFTTNADTTPPSITITAPTDSYATSDQAIALAGTATDDRLLVLVTWVNDRGGGGMANGTTSWSVPAVPLSLGLNVITVTAWDGAGNYRTDTIGVTSTPPDTTSPDTIIRSGPSGTWTASDFSFSWTGGDDVTPVGSLTYTTFLVGYDSSSTAYSTSTSRSFTSIPNGTYTFWVRATDEASNIDYSAATRTFVVDVPDTTSPTVTSLIFSGGGNNNDLFRTGRTYPIVLEATDNIGAVRANLYSSLTGSEPWVPIATGVPVHAGQNVYDWVISAGFVTTSGAVRAVVWDAAGNSGEGVFSPFTVLDGTPPSVRVLSPNGSEDWALGSTQTPTWTVSAVYPLTEIRVYSSLEGVIALIASLPGTARSFAWTLPAQLSSERTLIRVVAVDDKGNEGEDWSDSFFRVSNPDAPPVPPWHVPALATEMPPAPHASADQAIWGPEAAANQTGTLHLAAVYEESDRRDGANYYTQQQIVYRARTAGSWGPQRQITSYPVDVDSDGSDGWSSVHRISDLRVAIDGSGLPHVVWIRARVTVAYPDYDDDVFYSYFDGTSWSPPANLSASVTTSSGSSTRYPGIAVDSLGRVHVVWTERIFPGTGRISYHAIKTGNTWNALTAIANIPAYEFLDMVADGTGNVHAVTTEDAGEVYHGLFDGTGWTWQVVTSQPSTVNQNMRIAVDPSGTLHLAWLRMVWDTALGAYDHSIFYSSNAGSGWSPLESVQVPQYGPIPVVAIGMNSLGHPIVGWIAQSLVPPGGIPFVYVSQRTEVGWSPAERISDRTTLVGSGSPLAIVFTAGQTHVAWAGSGGTIWNWADYSQSQLVTPTQLNFGEVYIGQSAEEAFLLENPTEGRLQLSVSAQEPFEVLGTGSYDLGPGARELVAIRFTPTQSGEVTGTVVFSSPLGSLQRIVGGSGAIPSPANAPTNLGQVRADRVTAIGIGATTPESTVVFKATVSDPTGDEVKLQIEMRRLGEFLGAFTSNFTHESAFAASGGVAQITVSGLANDIYHWRARTVDSTGQASAWVSFGGNLDSELDFRVDGTPAVPAGLGQFRMDRVTAIGVGATTPESTVVFKATVSDSTGDQVKLQIEMRRLGEFLGAFTSNFTHESAFVGSGGVAQITVSGLANDIYHWRARTVDSTGQASAWVSFGGNLDAGMDFGVAEILPTVTITATDPTATESGPTTGTLAVFRTDVTTSPLTVFYSVSGSATSSNDYAPLPGAIVIPAGTSSAVVTISPIDDVDVEVDETVTVSLTSAGTYLLGTPATATVTILSKDFSDTPLARLGTLVQARHIIELRAAVDAIRGRLAAGEPLGWSDPNLAGESIKAIHIEQLRVAVEQLLGPIVWRDPVLVPRVTQVRREHIQEIRDAVHLLQQLLP